MTSLLDSGYFHLLWLDILLAILLDMAWLTPTFRRAFKEIEALPDTPGTELWQCRNTLKKIHKHVLVMYIGAIIEVVFAVWRPV